MIRGERGRATKKNPWSRLHKARKVRRVFSNAGLPKNNANAQRNFGLARGQSQVRGSAHRGLDFFCVNRAPAPPDRFIIFVGKRVFGVKLQLVDLESESFSARSSRVSSFGTRPREISSITPAPRKIRPVHGCGGRANGGRIHAYNCRNVAEAARKPPVSRKEISIPFFEMLSA